MQPQITKNNLWQALRKRIRRSWWRYRRSPFSRGVRLLGLALLVLSVLVAGLGLGRIAVVGPGGVAVDWNFVLVLITGLYVLVTYHLLKASSRQAAAAERSAELFREQLSREAYRRAGPILIAIDEMSRRIHEWEQGFTDNTGEDLPKLMPDNFDDTLRLAGTVDLYYHSELLSACKMLERVRDRLNGVAAVIYRDREDEATVLENQIKKDLKYARNHLYNIKANIYGWDQEDAR